MRTAELDALLAHADPAAATAADRTRLDQRAREDLAAILTSTDAGEPSSASAPASSQHRPRRRVLALAVAVAVLATGGTAVVLTRSEDPPAVSANGPAPGADTLLDALDADGSGSAGAAVLLTTPAELASDVDIVATGRFVRFQPGRTSASTVNPAFTSTSTVMVLDDVRLVQGRLPEGSDGNLYVEVRVGGAEESVPQEAADAIPVGTEVLVYARDVSGPDPSPDVSMPDPDAGRPAGQPVYKVQYVQGFALQAADDVVVWPQIRRAALPGTLAQALPGGDLIWTP